MNQEAYTIEVTGLSPKATEKDLYEFFSFSGAIDHVEIVRYLLSFNEILDPYPFLFLYFHFIIFASTLVS